MLLVVVGVVGYALPALGQLGIAAAMITYDPLRRCAHRDPPPSRIGPANPKVVTSDKNPVQIRVVRDHFR
jgi:hypothetical protein